MNNLFVEFHHWLSFTKMWQSESCLWVRLQEFNSEYHMLEGYELCQFMSIANSKFQKENPGILSI